ncbi:MAG: ATP-dependent helicase [Bacilli bacterium]
MDYKKELNDKQYEAVSSTKQYLRIIAGAGSGKTRVLTYRIAYLIENMDVFPSEILAITFTNKVANEMKERLAKLVSKDFKNLLIKTFHSFCCYFLRREIGAISFPRNFVILDEEDQTKIIKDIASELSYRRSDPIVNKALHYISNNKLHNKYPDDINTSSFISDEEKACFKFYELYEEKKNLLFALDFDDLILKTIYILEHFIDIRIRWSNYFTHILVDEFQDTNDVEYKLLKLLCSPHTSLYVVGDPDQTIYTWRGANQDIILNFDKNFKGNQTIVLERNYRSTRNILDSANKLIGHNKMRIKKDLFSLNEIGDPIIINASSTSKSEARYVVSEIKRLKSIDAYDYRDIAVLYRSNYVSMEFEQELVSKNVPYRIYGGLKFYQRKEIKDVLAYFHLVSNVKDDISFERIMNVPRRGIGSQTQDIIKKEAIENHMSMYEYIASIDISNHQSEIPNRTINALKLMIYQIDKAREEINKDEEVFSKILEDMITYFGYFEYLKKEDDADDRISNVKALFTDLRSYLHNNPESSFDEYLQNIALISAQDELIDGDYVTLMTAHTAKGLEYPVIFVVRFNNGVFPNNRALLESGFTALEEERRLAYVAFTRAKKKLYITYNTDYNYVVGGVLQPSSFISESGNNTNRNSINNFYSSSNKKKEYHFYDDDTPFNFSQLNEEREYKKENKPSIKSQLSNNGNSIEWKVGDSLIHQTLGRGKVIELEGDGIIKVDFENNGIKSILGNHKMVKKG